MASMSGCDYKSQDGTTDLDDVKSQYAEMQLGLTVF
jgi:regulator of nonsense transcripts 1